MTLEEWESTVPAEMRQDAVWKMESYRIALFISDLAWIDSGKLIRHPRTLSIADQLVRAGGKISANITEGYSRGSGKGRAIFYEYALGSARETRDWYYKGRHVLKERVSNHRIKLCTSLVRLLIRMASNENRQNKRLMPKKQRSRVNHQSPD
jgi:four helix bundle protein